MKKKERTIPYNRCRLGDKWRFPSVGPLTVKTENTPLKRIHRNYIEVTIIEKEPTQVLVEHEDGK